MKIFNKFIWSKKEPSNKNDIWFDGSTWRIYTEEAWQSFTLPVDAADKVSEMLENISEVYQEKLTAGEGIIIEDNEINLTLKTINGESIIGEGNIIIESSTPNAVESEEVASTTPTPEFPYATKGELTELSAEVSGLSERVNELGQPIFEAKFGETTFQEVYDAYTSGKYIILEYQNNAFHINRVTTSDIYFISVNGVTVYRIGLNSKNNWYQNVYAYEQNTNKVTSLSDKSTDTQYPSAKAVYEALQNVGGGGASTDKQGVIRQTQTWTQAADKGYDYVMSNLVRGAIPQANIDLFTSAGAVFNEESGYFELNGLTDISYEEMQAIYNAGYKMAEGYWGNNIRTNIFRHCNVYNADAAQLYGFVGMYANRKCTAESFKFTEQGTYGVAIKSSMYGTYEDCIYLKTFGDGVFFGQDTNISDQAFKNCYSLETIYIRSLKKNIWFKESARLSNASILYMIKNSAATSAIVITLHPDAKARAEADAEIMAALNEKTNVTLGA